MGMKDKGGRAFSSGNDFMGSGINEKHKPKGLPPKNKARAVTHRASRCVSITTRSNLPMDEDLLINDPEMNRANHLMGW